VDPRGGGCGGFRGVGSLFVPRVPFKKGETNKQKWCLIRRVIFCTVGVDAQLFVPRVHFQKRATTKLK
jgi:hypothetical protein